MKMASTLALGLLLIIAACTKTEKIIETRQADPNVRESFAEVSRQALTIKKSALEKAFLLIANSKTTGQQPKWKEHPIKIVSFERAGSKVGLFEIGYLQVYKTLNAQKMLQSFEIVSESEESVTIDIEKGFTIVGLDQNFEFMRPDENLQKFKKQGVESSSTLVDTLVKQSEVSVDRLLIAQTSRLKAIGSFKTKSRVDKTDVSEQDLGEFETSLDSQIEFVPYLETSGFKPKEQSKDWAIGSFLTRILKDESEEYQELALRWNANEEHPIRYVLTANTPQELIPVIREGLEYWNRVAGKKLIKVEVSDQSDLPPQRGAVIVRWIPYKDAGMAYAGFQNNPMTGEILYGHIYLTSVWVNEKAMTSDYVEEGITSISACGFEKYAANAIAQLKEQVPATKAKEAIMDNLRMVVAHEAGHTLGMRHNFAAAAAITASYGELSKIRADYVVDASSAEKVAELSTSVMDYTTPLDSSIVGRNLRTKTLSYDRDFIEWSYLGKKTPSTTAGAFCTDDHMRYAREERVSILGCAPNKIAGSPLVATLTGLNKEDESAIKADADKLLRLIVKDDGKVNIESAAKFGSTAYYTLRDNFFEKDLLKYIFVAKSKKNYAEEVPLTSRIHVTKALINEYYYEGEEDVIRELNQELIKIAATPEGRRALLPVDDQGHINLSWGDEVLKSLVSKYRAGKTPKGISYQMTESEFAIFVANLKEATKNTTKIKLLLAAQRLLIQQEALTETLKDKNVEINYRIDITGLKATLVPYIQELLTANVGVRSIRNSDGKVVEVTDSVLDVEALKTLHQFVKDSSLSIGSDRASIAHQRILGVSKSLAALGIAFDLYKTTEEQIAYLRDLQLGNNLISLEFLSWANDEIEFAAFLKSGDSSNF